MNVLEYKPKQQIAVKFSEELQAGQYCILTLDYSANLSHTYNGFYNSSYTDKDGKRRYTQVLSKQLKNVMQRKSLCELRIVTACLFS